MKFNTKAASATFDFAFLLGVKHRLLANVDKAIYAPI